MRSRPSVSWFSSRNGTVRDLDCECVVALGCWRKQRKTPPLRLFFSTWLPLRTNLEIGSHHASAGNSHPCIKAENSTRNISLRSETIEGGIDPALNWHVCRRHISGATRIRCAAGLKHRSGHETYQEDCYETW